MKALLGILLLSVLLTSGSSLECETCMAQDTNCSGKKQPCVGDQDACLNALTEITVGPTKIVNRVKTCYSKAACKNLKAGNAANFGAAGAIIKSVECSRAPLSSASFSMALSSLLFLKLLW